MTPSSHYGVVKCELLLFGHVGGSCETDTKLQYIYTCSLKLNVAFCEVVWVPVILTGHPKSTLVRLKVLSLYQKVSVSLQYLHYISWFWIINLVLQPHIQLWPDLAPNSQNVKAIMNQGTIMAASVFCNYVIFWLWVPKHSHKTNIML